MLNKDQHSIYDVIIKAIEHDSSCFFIDRPGGTGKTFLYNIMLAKVRSLREIALVVASSGVTALLITGGKTVHFQFKISIKLNESFICNISWRSKEARLINMAKLFVWDKALMIHKFAFEAVDWTFCDITQIDELFGGKIFVFRDDFC